MHTSSATKSDSKPSVFCTLLYRLPTLSLSLSLIHAHTLSVSISRLDIVEGSINTKLRLIHVHHRWHDFSNWLFRVSICATCGSVQSVENERHSWFFFFDWFFFSFDFFKKILEIQNKKQFIYELFLWSLKLYDEDVVRKDETSRITVMYVFTRAYIVESRNFQHCHLVSHSLIEPNIYPLLNQYITKNHSAT